MISVCIFEDRQDYRESLIRLIRDAEDIKLAGAWLAPSEGLPSIPDRVQPDVVLMDIDMPGMSGVDCAKILKDRMPEVQILMLTVFENEEKIFRSLENGANGYILKSSSPQEILEAIREINGGGAPMSTSIARKVVKAFQRTDQNPTAEPPSDFEELTKRENEILKLLAQGYLYKEIAEQLFISLPTVRTHIHNIYSKLHVRSRTEAVMKLQRRLNG